MQNLTHTKGVNFLKYQPAKEKQGSCLYFLYGASRYGFAVVRLAYVRCMEFFLLLYGHINFYTFHMNSLKITL